VVIEGLGLPDRYAVIGHPVAHSRSPLVLRCFAEQTHQVMTYARIDAPPEEFREAVFRFFREGGSGLNVTLPHKEAAAALADELSERARVAGAVNTLTARGGRLSGDNTDGVGLVRDLTSNLGLDLLDSRILVLGAGGAARGILGPLLAERPAAVVVANRTHAKARALAQQFRSLGKVKGCGFRVLPGKRFDVVINATSVSVAGKGLTLPDELPQDAVCYDLFYADHDSPFVCWAREHGARIATMGFGMLVEQAAESFHIWRGVRPATRPVIALIRNR
jgi:shikimate dehydrogenase